MIVGKLGTLKSSGKSFGKEALMNLDIDEYFAESLSSNTKRHSSSKDNFASNPFSRESMALRNKD